MTHGSLFSGIGGFDLAAEWVGWENKFHCEWNPFGQKVLKYYWPNSESFDDITKSDFTKFYGKIDVISGGFPCQPYSVAGKRLGKEDERHLWPEMLRVIREVSPRWVVGENVCGLVSWNGGMVFDEVQADLEAIGYEVQPFILPACAVNAPHRRDRVWFVAYPNCFGFQEERPRQQATGIARGSKYGFTPDTISERQPRKEYRSKESKLHCQDSQGNNWDNFPTQSPICGGDDGLPSELDGITFSKWRNESINAYGNAIVPQLAYQIFKSINDYDLTHPY